MASRHSPHRWLMAAALFSALPAASTMPAHAQGQSIRITQAGPAGGARGLLAPAMSERDLTRYADLLALDDAQHDAAKALLDSYRADFDALTKASRGKMEAIRAEFEDTRDMAVMEQMGAVMEDHRKKAATLEETLVADLRSLLTDQQAADKWEKFQRARRRERTIDRGSLSGESVDLVKTIDDLKLDPPARAALADALEAYEIELDRALVERNKALEERSLPMSGRVTFDFEDFQKQMLAVQDAGKRVRDANRRHARALESLVPEDRRADFVRAVKAQSFPQVYRPSRPAVALDAALKFDDLDPDQRAALQALKESYHREADAVNDRWAAAIAKHEEENAGGTLALGGGMMQVMIGEDDQNSPAAEQRTARRELDRRTIDSLETLLTPDQREHLPRRPEPTDAPAGGMFIYR